MAVNSVNPKYADIIDYVSFVRLIISDRNRFEYIYPFETVIGVPENCSEWKRINARNEMYILGGTNIGATKLTIKKLVGLFADRTSQFELDKNLEYLADNCTGTNIGLQEFCENSLSEVETTNRIGVLMDYPQTGGRRMTRAELKRFGVLPRFYIYNTESIIDWETDTIFGTEVLTQVRLKEIVEKKDDNDEFKRVVTEQYRVLRLRKEGYTQQLYDRNSQPIGEEIPVFDGKGKQLQYIPFFVCNADKNGASHVGEPPTLGMAKLDQAYLSDSCAHRRYVRLAGTGTLWFTTTHDTKQWQEANPGGVMQMGGEAYNLGTAGQMNYCQAPDTNAHLVSMEHTIDLMCMTGAALIGKQSVAPKTAFEILQTMSAEVSPLHRAVSNIEEMIRTLVDWAADMVETENTKVNRENNIIDLNKVFITEGKDTELMRVELEGRHDKVTSLKRVRDNWRNRYGMIPEEISDEELDQEIAEEEHQAGLDIVDNSNQLPIPPSETKNEQDASNQAAG